MGILTPLEGGFINRVFRDGNEVIKVFVGDELVGISAKERAAQEAEALRIYGGIYAPRLLSCDDTSIRQEFIEGESYEERARRGENVFEIAGTLLRKIHMHGGRCDHDSDFPAGMGYYLIKREIEDAYEQRIINALQASHRILQNEHISLTFDILCHKLNDFGEKKGYQDCFGCCAYAFIHGDFWLGNIIGKNGEPPKAIDWEFSRKGFPYEDFAIADLWIFREFPGSEEVFWRGYGKTPNKKIVDTFLVLRCVEFLATTTLEKYLLEEKSGFYHNKVDTLKTLCT